MQDENDTKFYCEEIMNLERDLEGIGTLSDTYIKQKYRQNNETKKEYTLHYCETVK